MISLRSAITGKLLNYFFINPGESLYVNELTRKLNLDKRNLVKKIKELAKEGLLKSHTRGNLKLYSINQSYPLYHEFKKIFLKTIGLEDKLKKLLVGIKGIEQAYIYGSYAQDKMAAHSDLDLLVIGNHKITLLQRGLSQLQKEIDREINMVNMSLSDYKKRLKKQDPFIATIFKNPYLKLI